jgi:hypothetical protein
VIPSCQEAGRQLLQTTPASIRDGLEKCLREASTVEGVLELSGEHFWTQAPGIFVGSLHARVRQDANEQQVLAKISNVSCRPASAFRCLGLYLCLRLNIPCFTSHQRKPPFLQSTLHTAEIFSHLVTHLTVQIDKDDWLLKGSGT